MEHSAANRRERSNTQQSKSFIHPVEAESNQEKLAWKDSITEHGHARAVETDKNTQERQPNEKQNSDRSKPPTIHRKDDCKSLCRSLLRREHNPHQKTEHQAGQGRNSGHLTVGTKWKQQQYHDRAFQREGAETCCPKAEVQESPRTWWYLEKCWSILEWHLELCCWRSSTKAGKRVKIIPIPQKGKDKKDPHSYRPISLLSCVGKLMEWMVNQHLINDLETNNILSPTQTGHRKFRSTEDQLVYLAQDIENAFQEKNKFLAVFFDLFRAFDKVWKESLLLKLLLARVRHSMYMWIHHFLFARSVCVKASPTNNHFPPAHRTRWSESTSEKDWRFGLIPVRVRARRSNPRPQAPGLPHVHGEASSNMAKQCGPGNQVLGNGRGSPSDGWICSNIQTKDLMARSLNAEGEEEEEEKNILSYALTHWCSPASMHTQGSILYEALVDLIYIVFLAYPVRVIGFIQDFKHKIPWCSLTFPWPKYGPDKWIIPCNPSISVKTEALPTLTKVVDTGVRHTHDITIGHVIPGPVFGYQLFQTTEVTRLNYDQLSSIITQWSLFLLPFFCFKE